MHPIEALVHSRAEEQERARRKQRRSYLLSFAFLLAIYPLLLGASWALNAWDYSKLGPVARAAYDERDGECERLVRNGAAVDEANDKGETALHWAVDRCNPNVVRKLIELGADVNHADSAGRTPLLITATPLRGKPNMLHGSEENRVEIARLLIQNGAEVNHASSGDGNTTLHLAAANAGAELVRVLLDAGASPNARDSHGYTPLDVAKMMDNKAAMAELQRSAN